MFKVSSIQYIYSRLHIDPVSDYFTFNYLPLEFHPLLLIRVALLQPSVLFLQVQPHPLFSQFSCPLLSFSLSLWLSEILDSPLKSLTTARRVLNLSSRVLWATWSLASEPWDALRELRERTAARPRSFPEVRRGVVMVLSSPGCSMSLMTSHR